MNTKDKLIKELIKDNWFIDLYSNTDRLVSLMIVLEEIEGFEWGDGDKITNYLPLNIIRHIYCNKKTLFREINHYSKIDLTQLFNNYLEEHEPNIWIHSLLAAHQLGLKIERYMQEHSLPRWTKWITADINFFTIDMDEHYRIDFKPERKLVPDEIWDILDDSIVAIAKNENNSLFGFFEYIPKPQGDYWYSGHIYAGLGHIKCLNNAKIHDIDWKDSLCIRPAK